MLYIIATVGVVGILMVFTGYRSALGQSRCRDAEPEPTESVSCREMTDLVQELGREMNTLDLVTAPQLAQEHGHIWSAPCGKRVYIN